MATVEEYIKRIQTYGRDDLLTLWGRIQERSTDRDGWEPGKALEYLVLRAFQLEGENKSGDAGVRWPFSITMQDLAPSGDQTTAEQIDGAVFTDGLHCLIECKDQVEDVPVGPIAKLRSQLLRRPSSTVGIVFSSHGFTEAAVTLARFFVRDSILLWEGREIEYALKNGSMRQGLVVKYRKSVERGIPNYNIRVDAQLS